jgi:Protein of unknown function (DUF1549)
MMRWRVKGWGGLLWGLVAISCSPSEHEVLSDPADTVLGPEPASPYSAQMQLRRASLALRGTTPSLDEYTTLALDPGALENLVDTYLSSPEFGRTVRDMWAERMLLRDDVRKGARVTLIGPLSNSRSDLLLEAIGESPLMLIEHVFTNDLPVSEMVTSDIVFANITLSQLFNIPWEGQSNHFDDWVQTTWGDGRPAAGLLTHGAVWLRWGSMDNNDSRGRANMISDALLCNDFSDRDVIVNGDIDLSDAEAIADGVNNDPACVSCHQALDPLASQIGVFVGGYARAWTAAWGKSDEGVYPLSYDEDRLDAWDKKGLRPPSYFGKPSNDLGELGQNIAADPRFSLCMAKTIYAYLAQIDRTEVPLPVASHYQSVLVANDLRPKALFREFVLSDAYLQQATIDSSARVGMLNLRSDQYRRLIRDLTGFEWVTGQIHDECPYTNAEDCIEYTHLGETDRLGFRAMAGGVDGGFITQPTHDSMPVRTLVWSAWGNEAAAHVVKRDLGGNATPDNPLLDRVTADESNEGVIREQLVRLHLRLYGELVAAESDEVNQSYSLFEDAYVEYQDAASAWSVTLSAMLQDPNMTFY